MISVPKSTIKPFSNLSAQNSIYILSLHIANMFNFLKEKLKKWVSTSVAAIKPSAHKEKADKLIKSKKKPAKSSKLTTRSISETKEAKPEQKTHDVSKSYSEEVQKPQASGFFKKIKEKWRSVKIDEQKFESLFSDLELALLENNVALEAIDKLKEQMEKKLLNSELISPEEQLANALKEALENLFVPAPNILEKIKQKQGPFVIVFFGINGSGKTTTIAKFAHLLKKNSISCLMAAADTFRSAAIEQLQQHGEKLGIEVISQTYNADPSAVAYDAIKHAEAKKIKVVLIDTAGRMHTKENLMREMEKLCRIAKPDLKILIAESTIGNDAIEQTRTFDKAVGIDGIILSKTDADEKGGTAISISYATGEPILFIGTGQNYDDLELFDKKKLLKQIGL